MRWLRKIAVALACLLIAAAAIGYIGDRMATARERAAHPPSGKLVDIGGYRIHLYCSGSGSPTVLLDAGFFDSLEQWKLVQPELAKNTRVCAYDRAGMGWSDPSPYPQTARQIAKEFHAALVAAGEHGPYVVVGHSIAGLYARLFADEFPHEVVGLVLEDSVSPDECDTFPTQCPDRPFLFGAVEFASNFGLTRVLPFCHQTGARPDCAKYIHAVLEQAKYTKESHEQAKQIRNYGALPVLVLAHDPKIGLDKPPDPMHEIAWTKWQQQLAHLSSDSTLIVVPGVGHEIQTQRPEMVVHAIEALIQRTKA
ncbi:MAG TPA: alpha/beta hydrolase [Terriglobales bacterium]|nr:alpha/beta hydrolase [Terriglobales bacterium]